jgi:hypothetical protein
VIAQGGVEIATLDALTGKVLRHREHSVVISGDEIVEAMDPVGRLCYVHRGKGALLKCVDYETDRSLWERRLEVEAYEIKVRVENEFVFAVYTPVVVRVEGGVDSTSVEPVRCMALRARDGSLVWNAESGVRRKTTFRDYGSDLESRWRVNPQIAMGVGSIACAVGRDLYLLDRKTCKAIGKCTVDADIYDVAWWGDSNLVIATSEQIGAGNAGNSHQRILVLHGDKFEKRVLLDEESRTLPRIVVSGDVVIESSRSLGLDLRSGRKLWTGPWRLYAAHAGGVYYGTSSSREHPIPDESSFGICDPVTGKVTVLYAETFK